MIILKIGPDAFKKLYCKLALPAAMWGFVAPYISFVSFMFFVARF